MWNRIRTLLEPPKHPGNTKPPKEPLADELVVARTSGDAFAEARTACEKEQTTATATRYITLLEIARQIQ